MTGLAVSLLLAAAPCTRVVVAPLVPLAATPAEAREVEAQLREVLEGRAGVCLETRQATIARLGAYEGHRLPPCADAQCAAAQATALETDEVVSGVVVGVGARRNVDLVRASAAGLARVTTAAETRAQLEGGVSLLMRWDVPSARAPTRWPAVVAAVAGVAAAGTGLALGLEARRLEGALSTGSAGCPSGAGLPACLGEQLRRGQTSATAANVLFGVAGVLLAVGVVLWVVELP